MKCLGRFPALLPTAGCVVSLSLMGTQLVGCVVLGVEGRATKSKMGDGTLMWHSGPGWGGGAERRDGASNKVNCVSIDAILLNYCDHEGNLL